MWPDADALIFLFAILPLLSGALSTLIAFLVMSGQPTPTIQSLLNLLSFGLMGGPGFAHGALPMGWALNGWFLGATVVLLAVDIVLGRGLTSELAITGLRRKTHTGRNACATN